MLKLAIFGVMMGYCVANNTCAKDVTAKKAAAQNGVPLPNSSDASKLVCDAGKYVADGKKAVNTDTCTGGGKPSTLSAWQTCCCAAKAKANAQACEYGKTLFVEAVDAKTGGAAADSSCKNLAAACTAKEYLKTHPDVDVERVCETAGYCEKDPAKTGHHATNCDKLFRKNKADCTTNNAGDKCIWREADDATNYKFPVCGTGKYAVKPKNATREASGKTEVAGTGWVCADTSKCGTCKPKSGKDSFKDQCAAANSDKLCAAVVDTGKSAVCDFKEEATTVGGYTTAKPHTAAKGDADLLCGAPAGSSSGLGAGAIAGIVIGVVVAIAIVIVVIWWCKRDNSQQ